MLRVRCDSDVCVQHIAHCAPSDSAPPVHMVRRRWRCSVSRVISLQRAHRGWTLRQNPCSRGALKQRKSWIGDAGRGTGTGRYGTGGTTSHLARARGTLLHRQLRRMGCRRRCVAGGRTNLLLLRRRSADASKKTKVARAARSCSSVSSRWGTASLLHPAAPRSQRRRRPAFALLALLAHLALLPFT